MIWIKKNRPEYVRGLLLGNKKYSLWDRMKLKLTIKRVDPDFLSVSYKLLNNNFIRKYKKDIKLFSWTINNEDKFEKYKDVCDSLICEKIDLKRCDSELNH